MLNFLRQGGPEVQHLKHRPVRKGCENLQPLRNFAEPTVFATNFAMRNFAAKFHRAGQFRTAKIRRTFRIAKFRRNFVTLFILAISFSYELLFG